MYNKYIACLALCLNATFALGQDSVRVSPSDLYDTPEGVILTNFYTNFNKSDQTKDDCVSALGYFWFSVDRTGKVRYICSGEGTAEFVDSLMRTSIDATNRLWKLGPTAFGKKRRYPQIYKLPFQYTVGKCYDLMTPEKISKYPLDKVKTAYKNEITAKTSVILLGKIRMSSEIP